MVGASKLANAQVIWEDEHSCEIEECNLHTRQCPLSPAVNAPDRQSVAKMVHQSPSLSSTYLLTGSGSATIMTVAHRVYSLIKMARIIAAFFEAAYSDRHFPSDCARQYGACHVRETKTTSLDEK